MADRIKGITVQIGGDTTGLSKALSGVNKQIRDTQSQLKDVNKLLKMDPSNTTLLAQKQKLLADAVEKSKSKFESLKEASKNAAETRKNYDAFAQKFEPVQAAIDKTSERLKSLRDQMATAAETDGKDSETYKALAEQAKTTAGELKELKQQAQDIRAEFNNPLSPEQFDALQRETIEAEQDCKKAQAAFREFGGVVAQEMQVAGAAVSGVGEKISGVGEKITGAGKALLPVTGAITGAGTASVVAASDFETSMAKLSTIADTSKVSTDDLKQQILEVSNQYGVSASDIAEAAYSAISAGQDTEDAVQFVADAMQLAKAGFTDSGTAIDTLTTILNAYGDASGSAADISDRLITAQNLGKTTVAELGSSMGKVIPTAAMYGVNLDNLASAYVTTTKNGISTAESTTYINGMLNELGKSGSTASEVLEKKTGKSFKELMDDGSSLSDVLEIVQQAADESGKSMADMFGSQEAAKAAATIVQHADDFNSAMDAMVDSSGKTADAFAVVDDTAATTLEKLKTGAQNVAIQFGETLLPVVEEVMGYVQQFVNWLQSLDDEQRQMIVTIAAVIAAIAPALIVTGSVVHGVGEVVTGIGNVITIAGSLVGFITGTVIPTITSIVSTIGLVPLAIIALVILIAAKGDEIQALLQKLDDFLQGVFATDWTKIFGGVLGEALNMFFADVKNIWDSIKKVLDGIIDFIRGVFSLDWERVWKGIVEIFSGVFGGLAAVAKIPLNAIIRLVNTAINGINGVTSTLNKIPGVNIGQVGKIPYLAKGGILSRGSAVVGEAGPELLTMSNGRAVVQPLTNNHTTNNANYGGLTINVYGAVGQDVNTLAEIVMEKAQHAVNQTGAVWA